MSDSPLEFDLKFLPDWLKETPDANRYANYQGDEGGERRRGDRGERGGNDRRPPGGGGRGPRDDRRGPPGAGRGPKPGGDRRGPKPGGGAGGGRGPRRDDGPRGARRDDDRRGPREQPPAPVAPPAALKIEFLPEPLAATGISKQIKSSGRAYSVFHTAKLFLDRPERHRVRVTSADVNVPLHQIGDGPVSFDRGAIERGAFRAMKADYYREEIVQGEPIKGNFTNVARARATGAFLGPTNHHGYQPALRKLYEERFSRRMSFQEFQATEVEIITGEQAVNDWKEQARSTTTYITTQEAEPITFSSSSEAEQHFRTHYLPTIVKSGVTLECGGPASRTGDRFVSNAVRATWESERPFPQQIVNNLRPYFNEAGLHYFKHRKRILYVSAHKPVRHAEGIAFSEGIASILTLVGEKPRIRRPDLAARILGEHHDAPELAPRKAQLAADLHYLIHSGHVIEFSDGALELPLSPKAAQQAAMEKEKPGDSESVAPAAVETAGEHLEPVAEIETAEEAPEPLPTNESAIAESSAEQAGPPVSA